MVVAAGISRARAAVHLGAVNLLLMCHAISKIPRLRYSVANSCLTPVPHAKTTKTTTSSPSSMCNKLSKTKPHSSRSHHTPLTRSMKKKRRPHRNPIIKTSAKRAPKIMAMVEMSMLIKFSANWSLLNNQKRSIKLSMTCSAFCWNLLPRPLSKLPKSKSRLNLRAPKIAIIGLTLSVCHLDRSHPRSLPKSKTFLNLRQKKKTKLLNRRGKTTLPQKRVVGETMKMMTSMMSCKMLW